jgi:hypothetical protein
MALIEQRLAERLIDLRLQESTGTGYIPIADCIADVQQHLDEQQRWRALMVEQVGE